jgi:3-oxoacyl-[acyl-carrier-protein] synthase-3
MTGNAVYKIAVNQLSNLADEIIKACNLSSDEISWMIPHQANIRIITAIAKRINLPMNKVVLTIETHGNTSSASIPLALDMAVRDGRIKKGDKLLLEGIGAGFSWGGILVVY